LALKPYEGPRAGDLSGLKFFLSFFLESEIAVDDKSLEIHESIILRQIDEGLQPWPVDGSCVVVGPAVLYSAGAGYTLAPF